MILPPDRLRWYVEQFNAADEELYANAFPNDQAWAFLRDNIPLFDCPDSAVERTYYFRWWTYRKHLRLTRDGWVVTEFLPDVPWAGKHNTINLPAGLHLAEGRWLRDARYLDDYTRFWFRGGGDAHGYTTWLAHALWQRAAVTGNTGLPVELLDELVAYHRVWSDGKAKLGMGGRPNGLFYTLDDRDGGEVSIGGHGYRPLINSAMYGDKTALTAIAACAGRPALAERYREQARQLQHLVQTRLWDAERQFFMVLREDEGARSTARELYGFAPWLVHLPEPGFEAGWRELDDPAGFRAPYGPTFAEQRHPGFQLSRTGHECQWNGPSWPLATSITLTALANLLNDYRQSVVGPRTFFDTFLTFAHSHRRVREDGPVVSWIDENLHPDTGEWLSRALLRERQQMPRERGKDYNHSTFCDLVISGVVGLRPRQDALLVVNPSLPGGVWDWFCLDRVAYHGSELTIAWDRYGAKYQRGAGLQVWVDGRLAGRRDDLGRLEVPLP